MRDEVVVALERNRVYDAVRLANEILVLLEAEELVPLFTEQYEALARIYYKVGDKKAAEVYGMKSLGILKDHGLLEPGQEKLHLENMLAEFGD
jgi:hypothetical protein